MELQEELAEHIEAVRRTVEEHADTVASIVGLLVSTFETGGKLLVCGNGGSAADSQHLAAEFVNRFRVDRRALPAIALTTDTSVLTSVANDTSYERVFARQVEALGRPGDVLIAISTSGRSANVLAALAVARSKGLSTIGFTGRDGRESMGPRCDKLVVAAATDCARIQESHEFLWHAISGLVEEAMFGRV